MWEIEFTDQFEAWWDDLSEDDQAKVAVAVERLEQGGPALGRPTVGEIDGSRIHNLKELIPASSSIRVLFVFDPRRAAILLVGGDKAEHGWKQWYVGAIAEAERLYDEHLEEIRREARSE